MNCELLKIAIICHIYMYAAKCPGLATTDKRGTNLRVFGRSTTSNYLESK